MPKPSNNDSTDAGINKLAVVIFGAAVAIASTISAFWNPNPSTNYSKRSSPF
jgi:hypothetical protein